MSAEQEFKKRTNGFWWRRLKVWLEDGELRLPSNEEMLSELRRSRQDKAFPKGDSDDYPHPPNTY